VDVHPYLPDDVAALPCAVVGRPLINVTTQVADVEVPVTVVGSRIVSDDPQLELDDQADLILESLASVFQVRSVTPEAVVVAGQSYPAYSIRVAQFFRLCC
jgi:hypothetical protein